MSRRTHVEVSCDLCKKVINYPGIELNDSYSLVDIHSISITGKGFYIDKSQGDVDICMSCILDRFS